MFVLIALGGTALLPGGQSFTDKNQQDNFKRTTTQISQLDNSHQSVLTHGSGPQIGLLALHNSDNTSVEPYPLDILSAESYGITGYLLEQELANHLAPVSAILLCSHLSKST